MENIKVFKGIDKQLNKRIVTNCIVSSILVFVAILGLARIPYRYGYNNHYDRLITIYTIMQYTMGVLAGTQIALWIVARKNQIEIYTDRIKVTTVEIKMLFLWKKMYYELLLSDIQMVSTRMIENCKYVVIIAGVEYKIPLEEAEKCVETLRRIKNSTES